MKIWLIEYEVATQSSEDPEWVNIEDGIKVSADTAEMAIEKARQSALSDTEYENENGESHVSKYRNFTLLKVLLVAESDI